MDTRFGSWAHFTCHTGILATLLACFLLVLELAPAQAGVPESLASLTNVAEPAAGRFSAGRIEAKDVAVLAAAGIRHVIDLSVASETPEFDEARAVEAAGMQYHSLPIRGAEDLVPSVVTRFDRLMKDTRDEPTLVHCSSSNRVGALAALRAAWIEGKPLDAALAEGRRWGLKGLEPAVRERITAAPVPQ